MGLVLSFLIPTDDTTYNNEHARILARVEKRPYEKKCELWSVWTGLRKEQKQEMMKSMRTYNYMNQLNGLDFIPYVKKMIRKRFNSWRPRMHVKLMHVDKQIEDLAKSAQKQLGMVCPGKRDKKCKEQNKFSDKEFSKWQLDHRIRQVYMHYEMKRCIDKVCQDKKLDKKIVYSFLTPKKQAVAPTPLALRTTLSKSKSTTAKTVAALINFDLYADDMFGTNVSLICRKCNVSESTNAALLEESAMKKSGHRYLRSDAV